MSVALGPGFLPSTDRLRVQEKGQVLKALSSLSNSTVNDSLSLERIANAASGNIWSARASQELRIILYRDGGDIVVLHADHHDAAYRWAERHRVMPHEITGELQIIDMDQVKHVVDPPEGGRADPPAPVQPAPPPIFELRQDDYLLSLGLPRELLPAVRECRTTDDLLQFVEVLPDEVWERLHSVADGNLVVVPPSPKRDAPASVVLPARFYVVQNDEELHAALTAPLDRWITFLHPDQRTIAERDHNGPVKVSGSAGTGKTVVAMHHAAHHARAGRSVLLTSFSNTLAAALAPQLDKLIVDASTRKRVETSTVHAEALAICDAAARAGQAPKRRLAIDDAQRESLDFSAIDVPTGHSKSWLRAEWFHVVARNAIASWPDYRDVSRVGRGRPLTVADRKRVWRVFEATLGRLEARGLAGPTYLAAAATEFVRSGVVRRPWQAIVVDEVQDLGPQELRLLAALAEQAGGRLMLAGDGGQRIYGAPLSLRSVGIDVRGRSKILRVNYRTTREIRMLAEAVMAPHSDDLDGGSESRQGTRSVLRGPEPRLLGCASAFDEAERVRDVVLAWRADGLAGHEIAIFARRKKDAEVVGAALAAAGVGTLALQADTDSASHPDAVRTGTMHRAKGLEFKAVACIGCNTERLPDARRLSHEHDPRDREEAIEQERRLFYVAMTRARDELVVSWWGTPTEFLPTSARPVD